MKHGAEVTAKIIDNDLNLDLTIEVTVTVKRRINISRHSGLSRAEAIEVATERMRHHFNYEVFR